MNGNEKKKLYHLLHHGMEWNSEIEYILFLIKIKLYFVLVIISFLSHHYLVLISHFLLKLSLLLLHDVGLCLLTYGRVWYGWAIGYEWSAIPITLNSS